ncbi:UNVERIFIED_CONTAM: hypothetical protein O8I53_13065 [Campylobacter lari]
MDGFKHFDSKDTASFQTITDYNQADHQFRISDSTRDKFLKGDLNKENG